MSSDHAREVAVRVFDAILPITFIEFNAMVDHEYARAARYASHDIEHELQEILGQIPRR
jgi:hypothetical protein